MWIVCALLALTGFGILINERLDREIAYREQATAEADLRGEAVSTLATDVRQLRAQLESDGKTPVAPDPSTAVDDLPARAEVPVPIPGPPGPEGPSGKPGASGSPGSSGSSGVDGSDGAVGPTGPAGSPGVQGEPGATGPQGEQGPKGDTGEQGPAGQSCPEGYSWQTPADDPYAKVCRQDGAPDPEPTDGGGLLAAGLDPSRRDYT